MAIKARIGDVILEVETEADLRMLLAAAKSGALAVQAPALPETVTERLTKLYHTRLGSDRQRGLIKALARAPDGLTDTEIRSALGFASNTVLAGVMASISKNAKAVGLRFEHVLVKDTLAGNGALYRYRLSPEMREVVMKAEA